MLDERKGEGLETEITWMVNKQEVIVSLDKKILTARSML